MGQFRIKRKTTHKGVYISDCRGPLPSKPHCPYCGVLLDGATGLDFQAPRIEPQPGSISVCWECGGINRYTEDLQLRKITPEELQQIEADPESSDILAIILHAQLELRKKGKS